MTEADRAAAPLAEATALLALLQLADSALPIGRHAHAMGLERLLADGFGATPEALSRLTETALLHGVARGDAAAAAAAHDAARQGDFDAVRAVDAALDAIKLTAPAQDASRRCGARLAGLAPALVPDDLVARYVAAVRRGETPGHLAVVAALCAAVAGVSRGDTVLTEIRGAAAMILAAAVRLGAIPAVAAQQTLARLGPTIVQAARIALATPLADLGASAATGFEVAAMRHARDAGRLFAT